MTNDERSETLRLSIQAIRLATAEITRLRAALSKIAEIDPIGTIQVEPPWTARKLADVFEAAFYEIHNIACAALEEQS